MDLITFGDFSTYIIGVIAVLLIALFASATYERGNFSMNIFLASMAIGFAVLIWIGLFPVFGFGICALCVLGIVYSGGAE